MSICRSISVMLFSLIAGVLVVSGIIFSTVRAQQSGSIPLGSLENGTSSSEKSVPVISATNSNNYAASIAALTVGHKPSYFSAFSSIQKSDPSKYTEKLQVASSMFKPNSFSLFSGYDKPTPAYLNYASKQPDSPYLSQLYSPYMMPVSNYYTGSSSSASSATSTANTASPYAYSAFAHNQPSTTTPKPGTATSALLSFRDRLLKGSSSNRNSTATPKPETETEKLTKQLQVALLYQQLMALQQYRALYSAAAGAGSLGGMGGAAANGVYSAAYGGDATGSMAANGVGGYPSAASLSSLYSSYYGNQGEEGAGSGEAGSSAAASSISSSSTGSGEDSSSSGSTASASTAEPTPTPDQLQEAIAQTIAYRQQLAMLANRLQSGGHGAGAAGGMGGSMGGGLSSMLAGGTGGMAGSTGAASSSPLSNIFGTGTSITIGYPAMGSLFRGNGYQPFGGMAGGSLGSSLASSLAGGAGGIGGAGAGGGATSPYSSIYGSSMPTFSIGLGPSGGSHGGGGGMLSSITGGLSALTGSGSGFGLLNSLGMLFG